MTGVSFGPITYNPLPVFLNGLLVITFFYAFGADSCFPGFAVFYEPDGLEIRQPFSFAVIIRMTHVVTDLFSFTADLTDPCHFLPPDAHLG